MRFGATLSSAVKAATSGDVEALLSAFLDPPAAALDEASVDIPAAEARRAG